MAVVMDDLITWLRAQLDEDERVAQEATCGGTPWRVDGMSIVGRSWRVSERSPETMIVKHTWPQEAAHIVRWDPVRVLAEIEAKRHILDLHSPGRSYREDGMPVCAACRKNRVYPCQVVRLLALPYADRDGYREEWRP